MTQSVDIYMGSVKIGSGTATAGSTSITGFSYANSFKDGRFNKGTAGVNNKGLKGEDVQVHSTTGSNAVKKSYRTRIITDGGTTLTMKDAHPFSD